MGVLVSYCWQYKEKPHVNEDDNEYLEHKFALDVFAQINGSVNDDLSKLNQQRDQKTCRYFVFLQKLRHVSVS